MKKIVLIICVFILFSNLKAEEISYKEESTVATKITESLESIYKELKTPTIYFYETSNFNCSNTGCTDSKFTNIGNISLFEYTRVGGNNSYLVDEKEFYAIYAIDNNEDIIITPVEERSATSSDTAGLRPNLYVKKGVRVTGSGTKSDPWLFVEPNYYISLKLENATINEKTIVEENIKEIDGVRTYAILPNEKHALKNIDCGTYTEYTMENNSFTLNNINSDISCTITYELVDKTFNFLADDQEYKIPYTGYYTIEAWGAQGADEGGLGAYASGEIYLEKGTILKINTGGSGDNSSAPGYNGGGSGLHYGGGASTVKINNTIIIAAAGGGGGKDGTAGGSGNGEGGFASNPDYTGNSDGGPGTAGTNSGGGGSSYEYSYEGNCSECYTGHNTCVGGTVQTNCSNCYTGSPSTCVGGYVTYTYNHGNGTITYTCTSNIGWVGNGTNNVQCGSDKKTFSCTGTVPTGACTVGDTRTRSCTGYCTGQRYDSCKSTKNTCAYGCDEVYNECATGENTCEYGCDSLNFPYNSGFGGANLIDSTLTNQVALEGKQSGNGKVQISYKSM